MKCVMYISKVTSRGNASSVPAGLSDIYMKARRNNVLHDVTGVLSFKNGRYLQILEGKGEIVDQLLNNIKSDSRHENVQVLIDTPINERSFPDKNMKLVTSTEKDGQVINFFFRYSDLIASLDKYDRSLVSQFYKASNTQTEPIKDYKDKNLTITSWPDFNIVEQTPKTIELSALLSTGVRSYSELINTVVFQSNAELDEILDQFNALDILIISDQSRSIRSASNTISGNGFYSRMKNFLGLRLN